MKLINQYKKILLFCIGLTLMQGVFGQDFHLSQYDVASLNTNPALTGMFQGKHRFHIHYRTQWAAVVSRPFVTGQISWDMRLNNKWSIGVQAINYNAGMGTYNTFQLLPSVSYSIPLTANQFHRITFGVSAGFFNKSFNTNSFTWGNQFDLGLSGGSFNQDIDPKENLSRKNIFLPDFNAGAIYFFANPNSKVNPFLGLSVFHLSHPNETFNMGMSNLPLRYLVHGGLEISINDRFSILPKIYWQYQAKAQELTLSASAHYYLEKSKVYLIGGLTYRNADAAIVEIGAQWKGWDARFSYDINFSSLKGVSHSRGASELSLTYILFNSNSNSNNSHQSKPKLVPLCPRL